MNESRFGKLWTGWDARIAAGEEATAILRDAKDEDLVEILAGESSEDRRHARDVIATELLNRLHARSRTHPASARAVEESAGNAHTVSRESQEAIHTAEGILKSSGEWELGAAVSASADASLLATEAAFDAAKEHAGSLQDSLAQSRVGSELAEEAVDAANAGREITRELEHAMEAIGRGEEGRAAAIAAREVQKAADHAADDAKALDAELKEKSS